MNNLVGEIMRPIVDALNVPLILALCLVIVIAITRTVSSLWYMIQQRGRRPLVIRMGTDKGGSSSKHASLDGRLLAYLAADGHGDYVIAPGAGGPAAPRVTAEALEPSDGWAAALLRMAIAREPSYLADVTWPRARDGGTERRAVVRISRTPGDRIVASDSFTAKSDEDLVEIAGCFCITFLRRQPRIFRRTPRWERWSQDINGYRAYRDGLEHQRRGLIARSRKEYNIALDRFHEAARIEPANLLVQLHRAALLELTHRYAEAVELYDKCRTLWPEHIETGYRLSNARKNAPDRVSHDELLDHLGMLKAQLALGSLAKAWLLTFRPWRWNPGERHYWRSWLQLRLPGRVTKRKTYLHAVAIGELLAELACVLNEHAGCPCGGETKALMDRLAGEILRKNGAPSLPRLLHPELRAPAAIDHDPRWHSPAIGGVSRIHAYHRRQHRGDIGWLALFNAACFFSLAIKLAPDKLPEGFSGTPRDWCDDCARAAIRELGVLVRNPRHALEPDWLRTDPDLAPLRESPTGEAWASFVGLPTGSAVTALERRSQQSAVHSPNGSGGAGAKVWLSHALPAYMRRRHRIDASGTSGSGTSGSGTSGSGTSGSGTSGSGTSGSGATGTARQSLPSGHPRAGRDDPDRADPAGNDPAMR
jgi:tetratricopeptide (TPR) repeat protein